MREVFKMNAVFFLMGLNEQYGTQGFMACARFISTYINITHGYIFIHKL